METVRITIRDVESRWGDGRTSTRTCEEAYDDDSTRLDIGVVRDMLLCARSDGLHAPLQASLPGTMG